MFFIIFTFLTIPFVNATQLFIENKYDVSNRDNSQSLNSVYPGNVGARGQTFTCNFTGNIESAIFSLAKVGNPTGNVEVRLYASSGTVPTGAVLASTDSLNVATLGAGFALYTFNFTSNYELQDGTEYCITIVLTSGVVNGANYVSVGIDATAPSHSGNAFLNNGAAWAVSAGVDTIFYVYARPTYEYVFSDTYFENSTLYVPPVNVTYTELGINKEFNTSGGYTLLTGTNIESFYWNIGGGYVRRIYSVESENFTITMPEGTFYAYGFTVKDYTGKLGLGNAYLEAYRTINGTETLVERMKIVQPNPTVLNLVFGRTYHIQVLFADGSRYDWGYFLAGTDTTNIIIIRSTDFTDQAHMIYNIIQVDAQRSADGVTITVDYNDTRADTVWANVTIQRRGGAVVLNAARNNDTYTLNWASADPDYGYIVSINGEHGDFGEWGYVWIFDEDETFPDAPSLDGIWDWGLGANLGGWLTVMVAVLGFSKVLKARALIAGIAVATLTNYIGFSVWSQNQLIFGWVFAVVVALASGGGE